MFKETTPTTHCTSSCQTTEGSTSEPCPICLSNVQRGCAVRILSVSALPKQHRRMSELGLCSGMELSVVRNLGNGHALIVICHGCRMVVDIDIADSISVIKI